MADGLQSVATGTSTYFAMAIASQLKSIGMSWRSILAEGSPPGN